MPGVFVKVWTDIYEDRNFFIPLSLVGRGVWLQLIVLAKMQGDSGRISYRCWNGFGSALGCDGKTARKILGNFHENCRILLTEEKNCITVEILNYLKYQELNAREHGKSHGKVPEISGKIPLERREEKTREEKTREDTSGLRPARLVDLWNEKMTISPKARGLTAQREKVIRVRLKEHPEEQFWIDLFAKIQGSDFLSGRNGRGFLATFDWVMKPANLQKILEGNYDNRNSGTTAGIEATLAAREGVKRSIYKSF